MKRRQFLHRMMLSTAAVMGSSNLTGCLNRFKSAPKTPVPFTFTVEPTVTGDSAAASAVREVITASWQDYLRMDTRSYLSHWTSDGIRVSSRSGVRQEGSAAIKSGMTAEWEAFERPNNIIAEKMTVEQAVFDIQGDFAIVSYWIGVEGGSLWSYSDQGLVFQALIKQKKGWKIAYQTDSWSLDYDVKAEEPGTGSTLDFDFAYPVNDLSRAVQFYTPLLGEPEFVTPTRAAFNLKGGRFILDSNTWEGVAKVKPELPNGYALFLVEDAQAEAKRLKEANVKLLGKPKTIDTDTYCLGLDQDENVFVLLEKDFHSATNSTPTVTGFPSTTLGPQAQSVLTAWLTMDSQTLNTLFAPESTWFDDTHLKYRGQERGTKIVKALKSEYWPKYDQGKNGIAAAIEVTNFKTLALGSHTIVSYDLHLKGQGAHPFQDIAWVTQVFNAEQKVVHTFIVDNNHTTAPVLELDYTGYPVEDVDQARKFYTKKLLLGEGYADEDYYGFWSNHAVFGLYAADPSTDQLPQPRHTNGYMSFWVRSIQKTYDYLQKNGRNFPIIPAINDRSGIDKQEGYTQLVTTDSEGNIILFTEYSGKNR